MMESNKNMISVWIESQRLYKEALIEDWTLVLTRRRRQYASRVLMALAYLHLTSRLLFFSSADHSLVMAMEESIYRSDSYSRYTRSLGSKGMPRSYSVMNVTHLEPDSGSPWCHVEIKSIELPTVVSSMLSKRRAMATMMSTKRRERRHRSRNSIDSSLSIPMMTAKTLYIKNEISRLSFVFEITTTTDRFAIKFVTSRTKLVAFTSFRVRFQSGAEFLFNRLSRHF